MVEPSFSPGTSPPISEPPAGYPAGTPVASLPGHLTERDLVADLPGPEMASELALADWRRRIGELYAAVRRVAADDPRAAWLLWRSVREALYRDHPSSPVPSAKRASFVARYFEHDPALRFEAVLQLDPAHRASDRGPTAEPVVLPSSGPGLPAVERLGRVELEIDGGQQVLAVFWLMGYAGGLFLPFGDRTNGAETYGPGRYLLDTAKGADLGAGRAPGSIVLDFNFAFQPSCAFDARWACPLTPPENRLPLAIRGGEQRS